MTAVVLLHAFPLDHRLWDDIVDPIAQAGWQVFTPDLRGFGDAPSWEDREPSLAICADDVLALLDRYGIDKAVIGGCSVGGYITLELLRRAPERVAGVILIDTKATADTDEGRANRLRIAESVRRAGNTDAFARAMLETVLGETTRAENPAVVDRVRDVMSAASVDGVASLQIAMSKRVDTHAALAAFHGPMLSIRGCEDTVATAEDHQALVAAHSDAVHVDIAAAGHLPSIEQPVAVATAITDFLGRLRTVSC